MAVTHVTRVGPDEGGNFEHKWEGPFVQIHLLSDIGKRREHNEDSCMLSVPKYQLKQGNQGILFAVADGMGGASAGERASRVTLETLAETMGEDHQGAIPIFLHAAVEAANLRVFEESNTYPEYSGMGTTVSAVFIVGNHAYIAHVGDSRVYLLRKGVMQQVTTDHSIVAEQVRNGLLTEDEARTHSLKNLITRAVGIREDVNIDLFVVEVKRGDTLLICSDGLCNMVKDAIIEEMMGNRVLRDGARQLVGAALDAGGLDNVTVALARITNTPPKTNLEEGAVEVPIRGSLGFLGRLLGS